MIAPLPTLGVNTHHGFVNLSRTTTVIATRHSWCDVVNIRPPTLRGVIPAGAWSEYQGMVSHKNHHNHGLFEAGVVTGARHCLS